MNTTLLHSLLGYTRLSAGLWAAMAGCVGPGKVFGVVQICDIETKPKRQPTHSDRFRLLLSDGQNCIKANLGSHKRNFVDEQKIVPGSIIEVGSLLLCGHTSLTLTPIMPQPFQLFDYTVSNSRGQLMIMVLDFKVVEKNCDIIGAPVSWKAPAVPSIPSSEVAKGSNPEDLSLSSSALKQKFHDAIKFGKKRKIPSGGFYYEFDGTTFVTDGKNHVPY